jgi:hypothetical protein
VNSKKLVIAMLGLSVLFFGLQGAAAAPATYRQNLNSHYS